MQMRQSALWALRKLNVILTTSVFKMFSEKKAEEQFSLKDCGSIAWELQQPAEQLRTILDDLGMKEPTHADSFMISEKCQDKLDENDKTKFFLKDSKVALDKKMNTVQSRTD